MRTLVTTLIKTAPLVHSGHGLKSFYKQGKHCLRGLIFARQSSEWFKLLHQPELAVVTQNHPYLFQKLQRPYLHHRLATDQRLQVLQQHYHFVMTEFPQSALKEIYETPGKVLAVLPVDETGKFGLRLNACQQQREGDLAISLINLGTGLALFTLAFSITQFTAERREIFIGGLQGSKASHDKELVIAITRNWHGLRPKALLLFAVQQFAARWDFRRLRAVADATHVSALARRKDFAASYDSFWLESGGTLVDDGIFDLPVAFTQREISELKVNKRPMYRRRYVMQAEIAAQISHSLRFNA